MYVNIFEILSEMGIFLEKNKTKENERPNVTPKAIRERRTKKNPKPAEGKKL